MLDIRWKQRFNNFLKAYQNLADAAELSRTRKLSVLEQQGLIQSFEFTHELAWNVLKDYLEEKGIIGLIGSKDATRTAFKNGLIEQGAAWMKMIEDRNLTTHTYNPDVAEQVGEEIVSRFYPAFRSFSEKFKALAQQPDASP